MFYNNIFLCNKKFTVNKIYKHCPFYTTKVNILITNHFGPSQLFVCKGTKKLGIKLYILAKSRILFYHKNERGLFYEKNGFKNFYN